MMIFYSHKERHNYVVLDDIANSYICKKEISELLCASMWLDANITNSRVLENGYDEIFRSNNWRECTEKIMDLYPEEFI